MALELERKEIRRIAILTGGGDAPGLNAVIRAVVRTAVGKYGLEVIGIRNGFRGLVYPDVMTLDLKAVSGILPRGGTILGTTNRDNPFKMLVVKDGQETYADMSHRCFETFLSLALDALIVVGGDGSLSIARELYERGMPVVGVPKTIDNDLHLTEQTFGYDTALSVATEAIDRLHSTAESHHRAMVLEVMGRNAGWIALGAGLAGGADIILIPEIPFRMEKVAQKILERKSSGRTFSIVVVAEGAHEEGKEPIVKGRVKDGGLEVRLGGIGDHVAAKIEEMTGIETRCTVLGHLQRGGSPTPFDRILATKYGVGAVEAVMERKFGHMVTWDGRRIGLADLKELKGRGERLVPLDHDLIKCARAIGISFGD